MNDALPCTPSNSFCIHSLLCLCSNCFYSLDLLKNQVGMVFFFSFCLVYPYWCYFANLLFPLINCNNWFVCSRLLTLIFFIFCFAVPTRLIRSVSREFNKRSVLNQILKFLYSWFFTYYSDGVLLTCLIGSGKYIPATLLTLNIIFLIGEDEYRYKKYGFFSFSFCCCSVLYVQVALIFSCNCVFVLGIGS